MYRENNVGTRNARPQTYNIYHNADTTTTNYSLLSTHLIKFDPTWLTAVNISVAPFCRGAKAHGYYADSSADYAP